MQKKSLVAGIIIGIILGYGLGQLIRLSPEKTDRFSVLQELLGSGVIESVNISVSGTIAEISGKDLIIEREGGRIALVMVEGTKVFKAPVVSAELGANQSSVPEEIKLEDLKVNDAVSAAFSVSPEGKLETISIFVVPEAL